MKPELGEFAQVFKSELGGRGAGNKVWVLKLSIKPKV